MIKNIFKYSDFPKLNDDVQELLSSGNAELFQQDKENFVLVIDSNTFLKINKEGEFITPIDSFNKEKASPVFFKPLTLAY